MNVEQERAATAERVETPGSPLQEICGQKTLSTDSLIEVLADGFCWLPRMGDTAC